MNKRTLALVAAVPVTVLTLTACASPSTTETARTAGAGSTSSSPTPGNKTAAATTHNAADITFAQDMIPHHQQAVQMARLAATRASDTRVRDLASRIEAAQDPEITTMTGWLNTWGAQMPGDMAGMDAMPGMMSTASMNTLTAARGAAFDKTFLSMMIAHHTGALTVAKAALREASDPDTLALARSIIDGQTAELAQMKAILGTR